LTTSIAAPLTAWTNAISALIGVATAFHNRGLRAERRRASPCTRGEGTWRYTFTVTAATRLRVLTKSSAPRYRTWVYAGVPT